MKQRIDHRLLATCLTSGLLLALPGCERALEVVDQLDNGAPGASDVQSAGLSAAYSRRFWRGLTGTAAASLNAFDQDGFNSQLIGSALVGLRYNF